MGENLQENKFFENVAQILNSARENAKTAVNITMVYAYYEIGETEFSQFENLPSVGTGRKFGLSWSHYLFLMRIKNIDVRHFYEIESVKNNWSLKELKRQFDSALYERLAFSIEKDRVMELSKKGQVIERASDAIKDPYILEFLGLEEKPAYSESELESRIIDHLQEFLMEMGKGFTFVVIDLKIGKLKHQDLGQMQMYVNYYDRYEKSEDENPTIGILLCNEKSDSMVELTLPEDSNIYASKYELYLPDKKLLQKKMIEWLEEESGSE